jgi:DUF2911 family protein
MRCIPVILSLSALAAFANGQQLVNTKASPDASVSQQVGTSTVTIRYNRPGVRGREIWGMLVPYDQLWRAGANMASSIEFTEDVKVGGKPAPAGKYAIFAIPKKESWTIILNKNWNQGGTGNYKEAEDLLRIETKPEAAPMTEWLTYTITPDVKGNATVALCWEKLRVPFLVETDLAKSVKNTIDAALKKEDVKKDDVFYRGCAQAYFDNDIDPKQALAWIDQSIQLKEGAFNVALKGRILGKLGRKEEGVKCLEKATELATKASMSKDFLKEIEKWAAEVKRAS